MSASGHAPADRPETPGYKTKHQQVAICEGAELTIRSLLDRQQFYDPNGDAEAAGLSTATWPLFGLIWPSERKLANLMQSWPLEGQRILEIGCGLALASLVIHRRLGNITASDCHPLTEAFLAINLQLNQLPHLTYAPGNWGQSNAGLGVFDMIIGSDVLYERDQPALLADFIRSHAADKAEVLIVDPNRSNRSAFNRHMQLLGFVLTETKLTTPLDDGSPYRGRLLHYRRNAEATFETHAA